MTEEIPVLLKHSRASQVARSSGRPYPIGEPTLTTGWRGNVKVLQLRTWRRSGSGVSEIVVNISADDFPVLAEVMVSVNRSVAKSAMKAALDGPVTV